MRSEWLCWDDRNSGSCSVGSEFPVKDVCCRGRFRVAGFQPGPSALPYSGEAVPAVALVQRSARPGPSQAGKTHRSANVCSEQAAPRVDIAQPAAKLLTGRSVRNSLSIQQQQARHKLR